MKKLFAFALIFVLVLAFAVAAMADVKAINAPAKIDKKVYDSFTEKFSANNKTGYVMDGIILKTDSKAGWFIIVNDEKLVGTLELAYKIGSDYFAVDLAINGAGEYRIGDGSGKQGLNHVKIGAFEDLSIKHPVGFIGYYDFEDEKLSKPFYWQYLKADEAIDWLAVFNAYDEWVAQGGYGLNYLEGWQTSIWYDHYYDEIAPIFVIDDELQAAYLENDYEAIFFTPDCSPPDNPPNKNTFVYVDYVDAQKTVKAGDTFYLDLMLLAEDDDSFIFFTQANALVNYDSSVFEFVGYIKLKDIASAVTLLPPDAFSIRNAPAVDMFSGMNCATTPVQLAQLVFKVKADLDTSIDKAVFSVPTASVYPTSQVGVDGITVGPGNTITVEITK